VWCIGFLYTGSGTTTRHGIVAQMNGWGVHWHTHNIGITGIGTTGVLGREKMQEGIHL
jgi:hypothetical protein